MSAYPPQPLISLDPPYRLDTKDERFVFIGWAEVADYDTPEISLSVNGAQARVVVTQDKALEALIPQATVRPFYAQVRFGELIGRQTPSEPFLLEATVTAAGRRRTFEYEVSEGWTQAVFGRVVRPRRIPPEHLQIRATGAAAGAFHRAGREVAGQIHQILEANGRLCGRRGRSSTSAAGPAG